MKTQFSFEAAPTLNRLFAIGSIAVGVVAIFPVASAQAVEFHHGALNFDGGTSAFYTAARNSQSFNLTFNTSLSADVSLASDEFGVAPYFPTLGGYAINSPVGNFAFQSALGGSRTYELTNNLQFAFTNGIKLNIKAGSIFSATTNTNSATFDLSNSAGSSFENGADIVPTASLVFGFSDTRLANPGFPNYTVEAVAQEVPEPFSIIGTIVGGTSALRMRKRLKSTTKV
ncbi:hypothetical protein [Chamaesiphon sp. VAR_48_metabat_135_sub]|uniref:hypothetical protein n=1 Tax=Chamaesiphon sp. VAR_48_metabat_135_sub TaxID=2964699 RepID=UPI00286A0680|nr:hypothetical protein [Chamaesiphon sp. VAR_48_metabat_135_sub]